MISPMIKAQIQNLSIDGLHLLAQDTMSRIGSHSAGGDPDEYYIQKQRDILDCVQEELKKRRSL